MKKILSAVMIVLLFAAGAVADDIDDKLGPMATERVRNSTRQMVAAGMPADDAVKMTREMIQNRFTERNMLEAQRIVQTALKEQLPVAPVMNKAYEGMAKRVQQKDVVQAMETVHSRYAYSYAKAGELTADRSRKSRLGNTIAESLTAGMEEDDTDAIMDRVRDRTRDMTRDRLCDLAEKSFETARDMTRLGVSSKAAADVVGQALGKHYSAAEMGQMRNAFVSQSRTSSPDRIAGSIAAQIGQGARGNGLGSSGGGGAGSGGGPGGGGSGGSGGGGGGGGR